LGEAETGIITPEYQARKAENREREYSPCRDDYPDLNGSLSREGKQMARGVGPGRGIFAVFSYVCFASVMVKFKLISLLPISVLSLLKNTFLPSNDQREGSGRSRFVEHFSILTRHTFPYFWVKSLSLITSSRMPSMKPTIAGINVQQNSKYTMPHPTRPR